MRERKVNAAMDIRMLHRPVRHHAVDELLRHLARCGVVEKDERLAVHFRVAQDRESSARILVLHIQRRRALRIGLFAASSRSMPLPARAGRLFQDDTPQRLHRLKRLTP